MKGIALTTLTDPILGSNRLDLQVQIVKENDLITQGIIVADDTLDQEAAILFQLNQGDLKEDPLLGCNLAKYIRSTASKSDLLRTFKIQFKRAGLNFEDFKDRLTFIINKSTDKETFTAAG